MKRLKLLSMGIATAMLICLPPLQRAVHSAAQLGQFASAGPVQR